MAVPMAGCGVASGSAWDHWPNLLKNRFYVGEVVYRGAVHRGDHAPILDRDLFAAVQAKPHSRYAAEAVGSGAKISCRRKLEAGEQVRENSERVVMWPADDQEKLARFVHEVEEWRAGDVVSDERRDVAKAV
jgi:hypothetical protein